MRRRSIYWIGVSLVAVAILGAWLSVWWARQNQVRALVAETGGNPLYGGSGWQGSLYDLVGHKYAPITGVLIKDMSRSCALWRSISGCESIRFVEIVGGDAGSFPESQFLPDSTKELAFRRVNGLAERLLSSGIVWPSALERVTILNCGLSKADRDHINEVLPDKIILRTRVAEPATSLPAE